LLGHLNDLLLRREGEEEHVGGLGRASVAREQALAGDRIPRDPRLDVLRCDALDERLVSVRVDAHEADGLAAGEGGRAVVVGGEVLRELGDRAVLPLLGDWRLPRGGVVVVGVRAPNVPDDALPWIICMSNNKERTERLWYRRRLAGEEPTYRDDVV